MNCRISVIIPAFNREHLIGVTLRSLVNQTVVADEIIVVNDGSSDGTMEVAKSFGDPVRVLSQANAGPAAARNRGFLESRGEFIHFFDSDDVALPNKHEVQLDALLTSGADIAYGPWVKGEITQNGFKPLDLVLQQHGLPKGDLLKALLSNWSIVPHACLFRRSMVEKVGGFPEELYGTEDQLMFMRCLLAGAKVVHSPGTLNLYRTNDAGKLTAPNLTAKMRHHREWAKFLLLAAQECAGQGIDASEWFGFRARAWQAYEDLDANVETDLREKLRFIFQCTGSSFIYRLQGIFEQKLAGLKKRLFRTRVRSSFRAGALSRDQNRLVSEINFRD